MTENEIATVLVDVFYTIHKRLGLGLYEEVYEDLICHELTKRNLKFERQVVLPLVYDGVEFKRGYKIDLLVEGKVIVEIKSVETLMEAHHKQIITYLKLSGLKLGLLVNFNVALIKDGIFRKVNNL